MSLLDDLDGKIEEEKQLASKKDEALQDMIERIEEEFVISLKNNVEEDFSDAVKRKLDFSITPEAIECFLSKKDPSCSQSDYYQKCKFSMMLIQNAYNQEHNNFNLPELGGGVWGLLVSGYSFLFGKKDNPINLTIKESGAIRYCNHLAYANVKFLEKTGKSCAKECEDSRIVFESNAGSMNASFLHNCDVYSYGDIDIEFGWKSIGTRFYSPHKDNLDEIAKNTGFSCSYYLLDDEGKAQPYGLKSKIWSMFGGEK